KSSFTRRAVDLKSLVEEIAHLLKTSISKKAVLNLQLADELPTIEADPSQVRQVVMNFLINASEALDGKSGYITVSAGAALCGEEELKKTEFPEGLEPGLYVFLEVADTGTGMDEDTRRRLFEPFFSTKFTGRGLGLAAVLGIVRGHDGAIRIETEPGKGTTFRVLFPALESGKAVPAAPAAASASGGLDWRGEGTVLLAEDEETLRALGTQILQRLGLKVIAAADGMEAVELFRKHRKKIDLVLLDLTMPRLDGGEALAEIRKIDPSARVVIASGYSEADLAERFAGRNLTGILQKPYSLGRLRGLLATLLPSSGPAAKNPR
ncbi:MAG: response regulator, partial [Candidatus Erginobacter occultus]|nr:response regulator [Candidatus Erginobacter occultus]